MANCDKQSVNGDLALVAIGIGYAYAAQLILTEQRGYAAAEHKLDIIARFERFHELCLAAECISAVDKIYLGAGIAQKQRILQCRVSAAVDGDLPALVKRTVAHGTEADAGSHKRFLAGNAKGARSCAGGNDKRFCLKSAAKIGLNALYIPVKLDRGNFVKLKLSALIERLRGELIAKLCTRHRWYAGEIFDLGRPCYLTAEGAFFYYENAFSRSQGVEGGS